MGHHHGHPLTGAMGLRPDHWSATLKVPPRDSKKLRTDTDQSFLINQTHLACIHTYIHIHHIQVSHNSPLSQPNHTNSLFSNHEYGTPSHIITMPHWYQHFHVSCRTHTKLIITIPWIISYKHHTHIMLKLMNHNSYTIPFIKVIQFIFLKIILIQTYCQHLRSRKTSGPATFSSSFSLRQKGLAQARRTLAQASSLRLGESSTSSTVALHVFLLRRDSPRLSETFAHSKT